MPKITCITSCYNEEQQLPKLAESIKGVDEWIVVNHLSTDKTAEVAEKLGAKVFTQGNFIHEVTEDDDKEYERRYGFLPMFTKGNTIPDGGQDINDLIKKSSNDWIVYLDADEIVTWNLDKVKSFMTDDMDILACTFIHVHNEDGSPKEQFQVTKVFNRKRTWFEGMIHGCITGSNLKTTVLSPDTMQIDHWQVNKEYRATYLAVLEYAYLKDQHTRTCFYLAREYYLYGKWDKSIQFFLLYLRTAFHEPEISKAFTLMAICAWNMRREEDALKFLFQAIRFNTNAKEPYMLMSDFAKPKFKDLWLKFADTVDNTEAI